MTMQDIELLHESSVFKLSALEQEKAFLIEWRDISVFEQWEQANTMILLETQERKYNAHISDIRNSTPISEMQLEHLIQAIVPQHYRVGLRKTVVISPEDFQYEMLAQTMLNRIMHEGIAHAQVKSLEEARDWVRNTLPKP